LLLLFLRRRTLVVWPPKRLVRLIADPIHDGLAVPAGTTFTGSIDQNGPDLHVLHQGLVRRRKEAAKERFRTERSPIEVLQVGLTKRRMSPRVLKNPNRCLATEKADIMSRPPGVARPSSDVKPSMPDDLSQSIRRELLMVGSHETKERVKRVESPQGTEIQILLGHKVILVESHLALRQINGHPGGNTLSVSVLKRLSLRSGLQARSLSGSIGNRRVRTIGFREKRRPTQVPLLKGVTNLPGLGLGIIGGLRGPIASHLACHDLVMNRHMFRDVGRPREIKVRGGHRGPNQLPRNARDFRSSRVVPAKIPGQSHLIQDALPLPFETEKQVSVSQSEA
jgi:hypothetical protein